MPYKEIDLQISISFFSKNTSCQILTFLERKIFKITVVVKKNSINNECDNSDFLYKSN